MSLGLLHTQIDLTDLVFINCPSLYHGLAAHTVLQSVRFQQCGGLKSGTER
jgi:hypothetical protein